MPRHPPLRRFALQWAALLIASAAPAQTLLTDNLDAERAALIERLVEQTADVRRLDTLQPVRADVLSVEALRSHLEHHIEEQYPPEVHEAEMILAQSLGMVPIGYNLLEGLTQLLSEQIAGLYDEQAKRLHIMEWINIDSVTAQMFFVHEITHALQDQHFQLGDGPIRQRGNDDRAIASLAVIEGDAMVTMSWWAAEHGGSRLLFEMPQMLMMNQGSLLTTPPALQQQLLFPYMGGQRFCLWLMDRPGGPRNVDAALDRWPDSTEQILHPERSGFAGSQRDTPTSISLEAAAWGVSSEWVRLSDNVLGEFTLRSIFQGAMAQTRARDAATGWDGDRWEIWRDSESGASALILASVWDSERDAEEAEEAFRTVLEDAPLSEVVGPEGGIAFRDPAWTIERAGATVRVSVHDKTGGVEITPPAGEIDRVD